MPLTLVATVFGGLVFVEDSSMTVSIEYILTLSLVCINVRHCVSNSKVCVIYTLKTRYCGQGRARGGF